VLYATKAKPGFGTSEARALMASSPTSTRAHGDNSFLAPRCGRGIIASTEPKASISEVGTARRHLNATQIRRWQCAVRRRKRKGRATRGARPEDGRRGRPPAQLRGSSRQISHASLGETHLSANHRTTVPKSVAMTEDSPLRIRLRRQAPESLLSDHEL
jgi:hypothetical protein